MGVTLAVSDEPQPIAGRGLATLPVVVLCGGLGTRLRDVTGASLPKALVPVLDRPFIDHKLANLAKSGCSDVFLLVGHGAEAIRDHVGNINESALTIHTRADGASPLGTGGAVEAALDVLPRAFWVTYGDTLLRVDVPAAERRFDQREPEWLGLMTVLRNRNQWEPSNVVVDGDVVVGYSKDPAPTGAEHIDYGMLILTRKAFEFAAASAPYDLARVIQALIERRALGAFEVEERFYSVGTPEALRETEEFLRTH